MSLEPLARKVTPDAAFRVTQLLIEVSPGRGSSNVVGGLVRAPAATAPRKAVGTREASRSEAVSLEPARARLLSAARALVRERGYESLGVREIAAAAGVSRQTFYNNFANKRECIAAVEGDPELAEIDVRLRAAEADGREWAPELSDALERALADRHSSPDTPRARLLRAADDSVRRGEFEQARIVHLTNAAGVSRKDFYLHFADKRECLAALSGTALDSVQRALDSALGGRDPIGIERSLAALVSVLGSDSHRARLAVGGVLGLSHEPPADTRHAYALSFRRLLDELACRDRRLAGAELERRVMVGALADAIECAVVDGRPGAIEGSLTDIREVLISPLLAHGEAPSMRPIGSDRSAVGSTRTSLNTKPALTGPTNNEHVRGRVALATSTVAYPREET